MEITDLISKQTIEAFELFSKSVRIANAKTLEIAVKDISTKLNKTYFYLEITERKKRFQMELERVQDVIKKESSKILIEWFEQFVLNENNKN